MSPQSPIELSHLDLALASLLVLASLAISWRMQLGLERDLVWGAVRSFVQLMLVGYVLAFIFRQQVWYWSLLALAIMTAVAIHTGRGRIKDHLAGKTVVFAVAIAGGGLTVLAFVLGVVLGIDPWYDPRYLLPLAGMVLGNALTAATLAVDRLVGDVRQRRLEIETALALGATAAQAVANIRRNALRTAVIPSVNALLVVGVVSLPGMMSGQIIAGHDPTQAVRYQVVVMYMITAAAALTAVIAVVAAVARLFTPAQQLNVYEEA